MSPTCFEPRGFIFSETVVYGAWYVVHVPVWAVWWAGECFRGSVCLQVDEPTRFETSRRQKNLNINLENCALGWFVLYNYWFCIRISIKLENILLECCISTMGRDSSVGIATCYRLDGLGIESWWSDTLCTRPGRPWGPTQTPVQWVPGLFPGVKRPGRGLFQSLPSSAEVKERVQLYLYSRSGPSWPVLGWTVRLLLLYQYKYFLVFVLISFCFVAVTVSCHRVQH